MKEYQNVEFHLKLMLRIQFCRLVKEKFSSEKDTAVEINQTAPSLIFGLFPASKGRFLTIFNQLSMLIYGIKQTFTS